MHYSKHYNIIKVSTKSLLSSDQPFLIATQKFESLSIQIIMIIIIIIITAVIIIIIISSIPGNTGLMSSVAQSHLMGRVILFSLG